MARGLNFSIQAIGVDQTERRLNAVERRMRDARPAFEKVARILESGEQRHFNSLKGRYVDTGALKASLTQPNANGAIRKAHRDELEFGTSIFYARFLRRKKKSAVLVLKPIERKAAVATILDFIAGD